MLARTGLLGSMPGFRPAPVHVVHPLPSVGAALLAANGIAAALLARATTGRGRRVETSLMAGALLYQTKVTGERLERHVFQTHLTHRTLLVTGFCCRRRSAAKSAEQHVCHRTVHCPAHQD